MTPADRYDIGENYVEAISEYEEQWPPLATALVGADG